MLIVASDAPSSFAAFGKDFPAGSVARLISGASVIKTVDIYGDFTFDHSTVLGSDDYFRVEIRDASGTMLAFTNPIFISHK